MPEAIIQRLRSEAVQIGLLAAAVLALHLATNAQYDFHRDSLYYMDSARHPAWGYVDYPPVTPTIARLSLWLFGPSVWGLRLWPTLAGSLMVVLTSLIARELGGGRAARLLAAVGAATSLVLLGANWLFQTVTFDQVVWLGAFLVAARLVRTGDRRLWLLLGLVLGVGLETKYTVVGLIAGLGVGTLLTPLRRHLATPWPWIGVGLCLFVFLPNLVWQAGNDWRSVQYTFNHKSAQSVDFSPLTFLAEQLALIGPLAIPLWIAGLYWLSRAPRTGRSASPRWSPSWCFSSRARATTWDRCIRSSSPREPAISSSAPNQAANGSDPQRLQLLSRRQSPCSRSPSRSCPRPRWRARRSALIRSDFSATVGWHDLVARVASVYASLPPPGRSSAVILTNNYGEAGAINTYGRPLGLPTAVSGELSYYYWKPASLDGPVIVVNLDSAFLATLFQTCTQVATITNSYGLQNEEYGAPVDVCRGPKLAPDELWSRLKAFR